ncbi:hypothetical protein IID10_16040 [candidate division KSB1 bacterium]|nr:hypothetical protein [candidate division KSB1 bacterium]
MWLPTKHGICLLLPILLLWGGIARGQSPGETSPADLTAPASSQVPSDSDEVIKLPPLEAPLEPEQKGEPAELVETPPPKEKKPDKAEEKAGDEKPAEEEEASHSLFDEFNFLNPTRKRRKGFPSETRVKKGIRILI